MVSSAPDIKHLFIEHVLNKSNQICFNLGVHNTDMPAFFWQWAVNECEFVPLPSCSSVFVLLCIRLTIKRPAQTIVYLVGIYTRTGVIFRYSVNVYS